MPWPSYIDGCYPLVGRPRYPELWRGCIGAWAPCLGPSGLKLYDWSPYKNHGTLTNMVPADDWVISGGRYALDFDGTNDWVSVPDQSQRPTELTVSAWVYLTAAPANFDSVFTAWGGTRGFILTMMGTSKIRMYVRGSVSVYVSADSTTTLSQNTWYHVFGRVSTNLQTVAVGVNGVQEASSAWSTDISYGAAGIAGQIGQYDGNGFGQFILDDIRLYQRLLSDNEAGLLSKRRGIAYEMEPHSRTVSQQAAFQAAWAHRRRLLIGAGTL